jgi:hypothetical protein
MSPPGLPAAAVAPGAGAQLEAYRRMAGAVASDFLGIVTRPD